MANKYIQTYKTVAEYNAAIKALPNVSLIKSTGEVYYKDMFSYTMPGDVLMWDGDNQKFVTTHGAEWDISTYMIPQFTPIGICVIPSSNSTDGKTRWISVFEVTAKGKWSKSGVLHGATSRTDGRSNTNIITGLSDFSATEYPVVYAANAYHTSGTTAGDWYLPAERELESAYPWLDVINKNLALIKNASSDKAEPIALNAHWSSSENNANKVYAMNFGDGGSLPYFKSISNCRARAFLAL